jgi:hypothetical protein
MPTGGTPSRSAEVPDILCQAPALSEAAKPRSTTHRFGKTSNTLAVSDRFDSADPCCRDGVGSVSIIHVMRSDRSVTVASKERIYLGDAEDGELCRWASLSLFERWARWESELMTRRSPVRNLRVLRVSASHALKYLLASRHPRRDAVLNSIPHSGTAQHGARHFLLFSKARFRTDIESPTGIILLKN